MPRFEFQGISANGEEVNGIVDAASPSDLQEVLRQQGFFVTGLKQLDVAESRLGQFFAWLRGQRRPRILKLSKPSAALKVESLSPQELMRICECYWSELAEGDMSLKQSVLKETSKVGSNNYVNAVTELGRRGPEIRDWARGLLTHPDYMARDTGASLLGQLGQRDELGDKVDEVIRDLGALINRPFEDDPPKESQAIDVAICALVQIGEPEGVPIVRDVLFSTKPEHDGDTRWSAAEALGKLVGEYFMDAEDPIEAARAWLDSHPDE